MTSTRMSLPKRKFIVDCDTGTDDAQAILMALAQPDIDLIAITTVYGNTTLENTALNTLRLLKFKNRLDIPVYKGCGKSMLGQKCLGDGYHGKDGLGDVTLDGIDPVNTNLLQKEHAAQALVRLVNENSGQVTLVATGPLTNVAMAINLDPEFGQKLQDVYIMGGTSEGKGNISMCTEFNILNDPEAAYVVLNELGKKITLAPLEICERNSFSWEWYDKFISMDTKTSAFIKKVEHCMTSRERKKGISSYIMVWDMVAMATAINNQVATQTQDVYVSVELQGTHTRGQMVIDWRSKLEKEPNVRLITELDQMLFGRLMHSIVQD